MTIEPIVEGDLDRVIEVVKSSFLESVAPSWSEQAVKVFLEKDLSKNKLEEFISNGYICLKASAYTEILGVLLFSSESSLAHLFVKPSSYYKGVARALFGTALEMIGEYVDFISLTSTEYAVVAYEKLGFRKSSDAFVYNGCTFQPMVYWFG